MQAIKTYKVNTKSKFVTKGDLVKLNKDGTVSKIISKKKG